MRDDLEKLEFAKSLGFIPRAKGAFVNGIPLNKYSFEQLNDEIDPDFLGVSVWSTNSTWNVAKIRMATTLNHTKFISTVPDSFDTVECALKAAYEMLPKQFKLSLTMPDGGSLIVLGDDSEPKMMTLAQAHYFATQNNVRDFSILE